MNRILLGGLICIACAAGLRAETRILFTAGGQGTNGTTELYTMDKNGGTLARITTNVFSEMGPSLCPDNQTVAYYVTNAASSNLFITTLSGGAPVCLNNPSYACAVRWLDTNTLCYVRLLADYGGVSDYQLWRCTRTGTGHTQLWTVTFTDWNLGRGDFHVDRAAQRLYIPHWHPSAGGNSVIVYGPVAGTVYDGMKAKCATNLDEYCGVLSPSGTQMVYVADGTTSAGSHALYISGTNGGCAQTMLSAPYCGSPCWSPDGRFIAFTKAAASTWGGASYFGNIARIEPGGSGYRLLTTGLVVAGKAAFANVYWREESLPLAGIAQAPAGAAISWNGRTGFSYTLEGSTNLPGHNWSAIPPHTNQPGVPAVMIGTDAAPAAVFKAYRVRAVETP